MTATDALIAAAASKTLHVTSRKRLVALGLTNKQIDARLATGLLVPIHPGVFLVGQRRPDFQQLALAAAWAADGVVSRRCAGALFRMRRIPQGPIEVTVPRDRRIRLEDVTVHRADLPAVDRSSLGEIPVTRPARVLLDIADLVEPKILAGALDHCLVKHLTSLNVLDGLLKATRGKARGRTGLLRELVDQRLAGQKPTESPLEDDLFEIVDRATLPPPERQLELPLGNGRRARFDGGYGPERVGMEADGDEHHAGLSDWQRDAERDRLCRRLGWEVLRFTSTEIWEHPDEVVRRIREARKRRG